MLQLLNSLSVELLIPGYKDLNYKKRLQILKLPTLSYRRFRGDTIEIYKIVSQKYGSAAIYQMFYTEWKQLKPNNI